MVLEATFPHRGRIEEVTAVEDERGHHAFLHLFKIERGELGPVGGNDEDLRTVAGVEGGLRDLDLVRDR